MKFSDYAALIALIISLFSLYRTYFHKRRNLKAVILDLSWNEETRTSHIKLLYINEGNVSELISGLNLNYYSARDCSGNYIGSYYDFGGYCFLWKIEPLLIQPKSKSVIDYEFKLTAKEIQEIIEENKEGKQVSAVLRFKRITDKGYWFYKLYSRGLGSIGAPFDYGFCLDAIINLNPKLSDETNFWVQQQREKQQKLPIKVVIRYRLNIALEWFLRKIKLHSRLKKLAKQDIGSNSDDDSTKL